MITLALAIVTAIGVVMTAVISWLARRDTTRFNLPSLTLENTRSVGRVPCLKFTVNVEPGRPRWLVAAVRLRGAWHRSYLAKTGEPVPNAHSSCVPFEPGPWLRRVHFDPPVAEEWLFLHFDTPDPVSIRFTVSLSCSPRSCKTIEVRYSRIE